MCLCVHVRVCQRDGRRWNADHAGTVVWLGWKSWHGNIAQCHSADQVPVFLNMEGPSNSPYSSTEDIEKDFQLALSSEIRLGPCVNTIMVRIATAKFLTFFKKQPPPKSSVCFFHELANYGLFCIHNMSSFRLVRKKCPKRTIGCLCVDC